VGVAGIPRRLSPVKRIRVTVLTGGSTPERDVALAGASQVVAALRQREHLVSVVDTTSGLMTPEDEARLLRTDVGVAPPDTDEIARLQRQELGGRLLELPAIREADVVFLVLHGRQGEGGELQALLELAKVSYTGSDHLGSAMAMDKDIAKRLFQLADVPTAQWTTDPADADAVAQLGWPVVVKPSKVGSTVGLTVVHGPSQLDAAVREALRYDDEVLIEEFIPGRELTVGILEGTALEVGEIVPQHEIFDYECKYTPGMSDEIFPAKIDRRLRDRVRALAEAVHMALKLRGFSRVDFRLGDDGIPYCLEANTLPGLTRTSLMPQSAAAAGIGFGDLCERICETALRGVSAGNKRSDHGD
jgi:D-alanine-D-alanine ligase